MKTFIFIRNKKYRPSTFYRIYQYIQDEVEDYHELIEFETDKFYEKNNNLFLSHLIKPIFFSLLPGYSRRILSIIKILATNKEYNLYIQRECFPKFIGPLGKVLLKKLVQNANKVYWDFDDNIFESKEITVFEHRLLEEYCNDIFVGNKFLLNKLNNNIQSKARVINTTDIMMENIKLAEWINIREKLYDDELILIWIGTKGNLKYLDHIVGQLDEAALNLNKTLTLKVISDGTLKKETKRLNIINIKWERNVAFNEMLNAHIGLMPLIETEFTKGKCAFKAVQAIGCGLPVIVSDVGMNSEVIANNNGILIKDNNGWTNAVINMGTNLNEWKDESFRSRELWLTNYNSSLIKKFLRNILIEKNIEY